MAESIIKNHDELLSKQARNEALNKTVETLSTRSIQPRLIRIDPPELNCTATRTIVHWILVVEKCGVVHLIKDDTRIVLYDMPHVRIKALSLAYSALMEDIKALLS